MRQNFGMSPTHHKMKTFNMNMGPEMLSLRFITHYPRHLGKFTTIAQNKTCSSAHVLLRDLRGCKNTFFDRDIIAKLHNQRLCANENPHGIIL